MSGKIGNKTGLRACGNAYLQQILQHCSSYIIQQAMFSIYRHMITALRLMHYRDNYTWQVISVVNVLTLLHTMYVLTIGVVLIGYQLVPLPQVSLPPIAVCYMVLLALNYVLFYNKVKWQAYMDEYKGYSLRRILIMDIICSVYVFAIIALLCGSVYFTYNRLYPS